MTATLQGWLILWGMVLMLLIAGAAIVERHGTRTVTWERPGRRSRGWLAWRTPPPEVRLPKRLVALQRALPEHRHVGPRHRLGGVFSSPRAVRNLRLVRRQPGADGTRF